MAAPASFDQDHQASNVNSSFLDAVITEGLLAEKAKGLPVVSVGAKSIVTPAALDWLRHNHVELRRVSISSQLPTRRATRLVINASNAAIAQQVAIEIERTRFKEWRVQSNSVAEAVVAAIRGVTTDQLAMVVILADDPELLACHANRNELIRAVAVASVVDIERVQKSLKPNVFVIAPGSRGVFEILRMVRVLE